MAFYKINDIDEEYLNKFIETFENLPIEEIKNLNRLLVEKLKKSGEKGLHNDYKGKRQGNKSKLPIRYCEYRRV